MMNQVHAERPEMDRRGFLRTSGLAGLGLAGAAMVASGMAAPEAEAQSTALTPTDIEVLQFALNIEYVEAEFYSIVLTGEGLPSSLTSGSVGTAGATTGASKLSFSNAIGPVETVVEQLLRDETNHIKLIRSALGSEYTIAKPAIRLDALGQTNTLNNFLQFSRDFATVGLSAYGGSIYLLSGEVIDTPLVQVAAQIALVEALHTGNLNLLCELNNVKVPPIDKMDSPPPPAGTNYFDDTDQSLAIIRTPSEVLMLAYLNATKGVSKGGFFPNGVNGQITTI